MLKNNGVQRKRLNSLQALRAIAFLAIFASHSGIRCLNPYGAWGVSVFFVLSGFVMVYSYYRKNRITAVSFKHNLLFAINKIKVLYPLHILTIFIGGGGGYFGKILILHCMQ